MSTAAPTLPAVSPTADGALRLADWGLIRAEGADAATFLHSQLTQDVKSLQPGQARLAGYCSAKGRLLASFVVWCESAETLWLACSADLLAPTLKRLNMFVLRAKCKLSDASAERVLWGTAGASAAGLLGQAGVWTSVSSPEGTLVRLPDGAGLPRALWCRAADAAAPALPALDAGSWAWLEVHSGVARVVAATVEQFVPQMVNLELVGGVNFQKGCYPGQEVVARSQYRGTLKRRAVLFDSAAALNVGQEIFHDADPGQPAGLVALAAPRPDGGSSALVEVKLAALDSGTLHAGAADGPVLARGALPYALPQEAA
ncbi:CAF17-like 4Fe-4S cluster assembly/insertion protein YgfZ [Aquabacterium sp. OR-4]|uniref:CAF17-like 4Fe-4S cluster assembly/insertion protein YgfZ n=1 Tax=Aquabacterium sp. OR-4 TaxID=2978127 RepID=UPI0021B2CBF2|nr:folate-binding protein [Aquabacterium sp. OR-4]MDT7834664.1 folate-binding protein [Aquabacterium sp. OR-4]